MKTRHVGAELIRHVMNKFGAFVAIF